MSKARINADGTFTNPFIWADVPDPDVIRVGDTYYMTSTTMYFNPGCPVMKSKDLVNWEIVNYVYDILDESDSMTLKNGRHAYGAGSWASCLREYNGTYYVAVASNNLGKTYVFQTKDIENGVWERYTLDGIFHDSSLLFDDDRVYLVYGGGAIRVIELTSDAKAIKPGGLNKVIIENADISGGNSLAEGSHIYKINGMYYIFIIGWPRTGTGRRIEVCYRSDRIDGEYEGKIILDDNIGFQNAGAAQGGIVDTPDGNWYALIFQDHGSVGRIPVLVPATWEDGWPILGVNGKVPEKMPFPAKFCETKGIVISDEFNDPNLALEWQWNHNPDNCGWSLTDRCGWLRLTAGSVCRSLSDARNTLTQRTFGPECSGSVFIDVSHMQNGDYAGIAALQDRYGFAGVKMSGGLKYIVMSAAGEPDPNSPRRRYETGIPEREVESILLEQDTVYLKAEFDFKDSVDEAYFYYSLDGIKWHRIGNVLKMSYRLSHFTGYRFALFNFTTQTSGGYVDFDWFRVSDKITGTDSDSPVYLQNSGTENVALLDSYLANAESKAVKYLLSLEPEKFLYDFYRTCGVAPSTDRGYENTWEASTGNNFRGHMFGHYMSSLSQAYISNKDASLKARLLEKIKACINGVIKCQKSYADVYPEREGYISSFTEYWLNKLDGLTGGGEREPNSNTIVPWYNLHKVLSGLVNTYKNVKDDPIGALAFEAAKSFGNYIYNCRASKWTSVQKNAMLGIEYGGMNEALYELYDLTGNADYKYCAECFDEVSLFEKLAAGQDVLAGKHANTMIPKFMGALKRYSVLTQNTDYYNALTQTEKEKLPMYLKAVENFFDIVLSGHSFVTGGNSQSEHFHRANTMSQRINSETTHETCNEYNMLKIAREMFKLTNDKKYSDYYENTFINSIVSSQNPETGEMMYFQPMGSGYNKVFRYDRFWCCTGTGSESFTKLGDSVYFKYNERVYVNMYFSSDYSCSERNLYLKQEADLPNHETVKFTVGSLDTDKEVAPGTNIYFRIPDWTSDITLKINGQITAPVICGGYIIAENAVKGDVIELVFPMKVEVYALKDNTNTVAFKYGPTVLSTGLGTHDMDATVPNGIMVLAAVHDPSAPGTIAITNGETAAQWKENINKNFIRIEDSADGKVQFKLHGTNMDEKLIYSPHFMRYKERYGLYMTLSENQ